MSVDQDSMDDHMKLAFLILALLLAVLTVFLCSVWRGYRTRQKARERRQHEFFVAIAERRGRRRRIQSSEDYVDHDDELEDHDDKEDKDSPKALWMRLERIANALEFRTVPSRPSEGGAERRVSHDLEGNKADDDPTETTESGPCGDEKSNDDTDDHSVAGSSPDTPKKRLSSSSLPALGDSGVLLTSIMGSLISPWWKTSENDENVCCICLEAYQPDQMICSPKCSDCNHVFHDHCAIPWFRKHDECPMCRTNILASIPTVTVDGHDSNGKSSSSSSLPAAFV